jgi:hypothetical protein
MHKTCPITGEHRCKCYGENIPSVPTDPYSTLRKLFTDHAVFTSKFIITYGQPINSFITTRLLENQKDIGMFLGEFVGESNGKLITKLLTEHIKLAANCVKVLFSNKDTAVAVAKLYKNGDDVAKALCSLSSYLDCERVTREFHHHNELVVNLAILEYKKEYEQEIELYDAYYTHMLLFSDFFYTGFIYKN